MQILPSASEHTSVVSRIQEANENQGKGYEIRLSLTANPHTGPDADLSEAWEAGQWGQTGIPITLDATIQGFVPERLQYAKTELQAEIAGVLIPQMTGQKTLFFNDDSPYTTALLTSSAGSLLSGEDAIKLPDDTEYLGAKPSRIVRDITKLLPYEHNRVEIEDVPGGVVVTFAGSLQTPRLSRFERTGDALSRLSELKTVGYRYRDTADRGFVAWLPKPLGNDMGGVPEELGGYRTYSAENLPSWHTQRPQPNPELYAAVRVYGMNPETGRVTWTAIEGIPYPPEVPPPNRLRYLDIPFEDTTEEGQLRGRRHAKAEAVRIARNSSSGPQLTLPAYDPLIERNDPLVVHEMLRDPDGLHEVLWAMSVDAYAHRYGTASGTGPSLTTDVAYTATRLHYERIATPDFIIPRPTPGVIKTPEFLPPPRPSYGVEGDTLYFDEPVTWAEPQGDDMIFHENPTTVTIEFDDIVVSG